MIIKQKSLQDLRIITPLKHGTFHMWRKHYCLASSVGGTSTTSNFQIVIRLLAANQLIL